MCKRAPCVRILNMIQFCFDFRLLLTLLLLLLLLIFFSFWSSKQQQWHSVDRSRELDCCLNRFYHHHYRQCSSGTLASVEIWTATDYGNNTHTHTRKKTKLINIAENNFQIEDGREKKVSVICLSRCYSSHARRSERWRKDKRER